MIRSDIIELSGTRQHACYQCTEKVSLNELLLVDDLIEHSPCFAGISENFAHCSAEDDLFHDNIVNCCATCYARIVQGLAFLAVATRRAEVSNLVRALRSRPQVHA
nr:hypothetical protein [Candidatus Sigynarchaeota archaeon]